MRETPTALPPLLSEALLAIGRKLARSEPFADELTAAIGLLADLSAGQVARLDTLIVRSAGLAPQVTFTSAENWLVLRPAHAEQLLLQTPGLECLFLFHRDGRLREAALRKITGGLPGAFILATVLWRMNDWVAAVRRAAVRCARRSFPVTEATIMAPAVIAVLVPQASWGRWSDERTVLYEALGRVDVAGKVADHVIGQVAGPMTSILRQAIRAPSLDAHLDRISLDAVQPTVRALALHALIEGKAKWPSGWTWKWIDKPMGIRQRVLVFDERPVAGATPKLDLIDRGVRDRSAAVRRVALDGAIAHFPRTEESRAFALTLATDRSPSVRQRAAFILRSIAAAS